MGLDREEDGVLSQVIPSKVDDELELTDEVV